MRGPFYLPLAQGHLIRHGSAAPPSPSRGRRKAEASPLWWGSSAAGGDEGGKTREPHPPRSSVRITRRSTSFQRCRRASPSLLHNQEKAFIPPSNNIFYIPHIFQKSDTFFLQIRLLFYMQYGKILMCRCRRMRVCACSDTRQIQRQR